MQITTKSGKVIEITRVGDSLTANVNGVNFQVDQTASGCKSRWIVREFKGRVEIVLADAELEKVNALFGELHADIDARLSTARAADARHTAVLRAMHSDANAV